MSSIIEIENLLKQGATKIIGHPYISEEAIPVSKSVASEEVREIQKLTSLEKKEKGLNETEQRIKFLENDINEIIEKHNNLISEIDKIKIEDMPNKDILKEELDNLKTKINLTDFKNIKEENFLDFKDEMKDIKTFISGNDEQEILDKYNIPKSFIKKKKFNSEQEREDYKEQVKKTLLKEDKEATLLEEKLHTYVNYKKYKEVFTEEIKIKNRNLSNVLIDNLIGGVNNKLKIVEEVGNMIEGNAKSVKFIKDISDNINKLDKILIDREKIINDGLTKLGKTEEQFNEFKRGIEESEKAFWGRVKGKFKDIFEVIEKSPIATQISSATIGGTMGFSIFLITEIVKYYSQGDAKKQIIQKIYKKTGIDKKLLDLVVEKTKEYIKEEDKEKKVTEKEEKKQKMKGKKGKK